MVSLLHMSKRTTLFKSYFEKYSEEVCSKGNISSSPVAYPHGGYLVYMYIHMP